MYFVWLKVIVFTVSILKNYGLNDPYEVLGVKRFDSPSVIRSAYRKLAKEWHPDINKDDPNAESKMQEINEAYDILSDPTKKEQYDRFGTAGESRQPVDPHQHFFHEFRKGHSFVFDDFMFGSNYHSHANRKVNVLTRYSYEHVVLPDSYTKVFIIHVYGEFCFECARLQPMWERLTENLDNIGIGVYELNYDRDPRLAREIGAQGYPQFIGVVAGRTIKYKSYEVSERGIREFLSALLPHNLITRVTNDYKDFFEQSFLDNKPQCLLFSKHIFFPLLYEVVAYEYRSKIKFVYVDVRDANTQYLRDKYDIVTNEPAVVIVKEEPSSPVAVVRGAALRRGTLRGLVSKNLYFVVPRLSSQQIFDELCPKMSLSRRWLCVLLLGNSKISFSTQLWKLRQLAKDESFEKKRVRFFYIYQDIQETFLKNFEGPTASAVPCSDGTKSMEILMLWRQPDDKVLYDWFDNGWCGSDSSVKELTFYIAEHTTGEDELVLETKLTDLNDEHYHGVFWDFVRKCYGIVQHVVDSLESPSWHNLSSIGFILLVVIGIIFSCFIPIASEFISDKPTKTDLPRHVPQVKNTTILGIQKLDVNNEKKFIREAKSGRLTVAVIVDSIDVDDVAASPIMQAFADAIYGYTGNPCYTFTWLSIAENLMWCTDIMNVNKFGEFLPGTVLALNGFRKYVYIFKTSTASCGETSSSGHSLSANFIGLESSDDETDNYPSSEKQKVRRAAVHLRKELPRWLERLFDGTLPNKIKVESWPKMES